MNGRTGPRFRTAFACLALVVLVAIPYARVVQHGFSVCDDNLYVTSNAFVLRGLSWEGVHWAFAAPHAGNWHPLTWLSHMADSQLWGTRPGPPHAMNLVLHASSAVLLFLALRLMTGAFWPALTAAGLWALHPLRVESVAWIAERKDVLSGFFWMLTLLAYGWYAGRPRWNRYLLVAAALALGLMAKAMLVTLPFVLLLLDVWPLNRWARLASLVKTGSSAGPEFPRRSGGWLLMEKAPLLLLSAGFSMVAVLSQAGGGAISGLERVPLGFRVSNALHSYAAYIGKTLWPWNLAVFYPFTWLQTDTPWKDIAGPVAVSLLVLVAVTALVIVYARRRPCLAVGWLWYLGTLVPVIGLVQIGSQAMADRYTYLPLIGPIVAVVWVVYEWAATRPRKQIAAGAAVLVAAAWLALTWRQVGFWEDDFTLFEHAAAITENNAFAYNFMGVARDREGRRDESEKWFRKAAAVNPFYDDARNNVGVCHERRGQYREAEAEFLAAVGINPRHADAWENIGIVRAIQGQFARAADAYRQAIRIRPDKASYHSNLAVANLQLGNLAEARTNIEDAFAITPDAPDLHNILGAIYATEGDRLRARAEFEAALRLQPGHAAAQENLRQLQALTP